MDSTLFSTICSPGEDVEHVWFELSEVKFFNAIEYGGFVVLF